MKKPHRCNSCKSRFSLRRHKDDYIIDRRCPHCGSKNFYFDSYEYKARMTAKSCTCDGYPFPHRRASKWCDHNPNLPMDEGIRRMNYGN